jgi:hypothetical protein
LSLEKAAQSLVEQLPGVELNKRLRDRQRRVERLLYVLGGTGGAVFVVSIFWTIITEIIIGKGHVLGGLMFLAFILGFIIFALLGLYRESLLRASGKRAAGRLTQPQSEDTGRLLPESQRQVPSVTESTTELLDGKKTSEAE